MIVRQSDLASFSYCAMRQRYDVEAKHGGRPQSRLSQTIAGTVYHFALEVLQREIHAGNPDALKVAQATFEHYWNPEHTAEISEGPPTIWGGRQTWGGVLAQSRVGIAGAHEWLTTTGAKDVLLGTETSFNVPIEIDGEVHTLHGTLDRLVIRMLDRVPTLGIDDWKSGIKPTHLQYAMQFTIYAWASMQPDFWWQFDTDEFQEVVERVNSRGYDFFPTPDQLPLMPRAGRWLSVQNGVFGVHSAGYRTEEHYARMRLTISQYIKAVRGEIYPLTTETKRCANCQWRLICGDAPLPALQEDVDVQFIPTAR